MGVSATALCKSFSEEMEVATKLKGIPGVTIIESELAIRIDFEPTDTMTDAEEMMALAYLIDIVESVEIHGIALSP